MPSLSFKNFVLLNNDEKQLVLSWRNSDRIRLKMNNQSIISLENHLNWISSLKNYSDCKYYIFYIDNTPCGVFSFININCEECECGSYMGNETYLGFGILLNYLGFDCAFSNLNIRNINITVLKNNMRVYKMHKTIFFAEDASETQNEWLLCLNVDNWNLNKQKIKKNIEKLYADTHAAVWED